MRDLSHALVNTSFRKSTKISAFQVNIALIVGIIVLGLMYLFAINAMATEGIKIKQLTSQIKQLEDEQRKLELQSSSLQSVTTIQQETKQLNFVPATNVTYLRDDSYALK